MSTNNLESATNSTFHVGGSSPGVTPLTIVLHTHHRRKGNKLMRRQERERETRLNESEIQKSKVGDKNNSQASDHSNFV